MRLPSTVLRPPGEEGHRVTFFELFFDLVYVFAVTQLSHGLLEHPTVGGVLQTVVLLLAVWWAWVYTAWATNWLDPDSRPVRIMLIAVMAAGLVMATAIPEAFGDGGLTFAVMYAAIQVGRSAFVLVAFRDHPTQRRNFQRIISWNIAASLLWVLGGIAGGPARDAIWVVALVVDYVAPATGYWVPGLGRSRTTEWSVTGGHFAERFKLFVILALGESILVAGATFSGLEPSVTATVALILAFVGSVAMWWIYFDQSAEAGSVVLEQTGDPGRIARSAYTYFHLPMVAGIIVAAVADELVIAHPDAAPDTVTAVASFAGPALFLAGHALFKWAVFGVVSLPRLIGIGGLALTAAIGPLVPSFVVAGLVAGVLVAIAGWDAIRAPAAAER